MRDKAFVEGEQVVPSADALRTYRYAFRAGTVGVVLAPDEETAPNQVRVEMQLLWWRLMSIGSQ